MATSEVSEACCTPAPPAEHVPQGHMGTIGGLKAYLNKPESATKAIIFASDIFGFDPPLMKKFADRTAAEGIFVIVPDYFKGDPYVAKDPANLFANFAPWIAAHHPDASVEVSKTIIQELKDQGIKSIGCSGFCWGAALAAQLANEDSLVNAIVLLHPAFTKVDDIKEVKKPIAVLGAEFDEITPPSLTEEFRKILEDKPEVPSFVKIYWGQRHGWSIRYDVNNPSEVKGALEAQGDMLQFYAKHL